MRSEYLACVANHCLEFLGVVATPEPRHRTLSVAHHHDLVG